MRKHWLWIFVVFFTFSAGTSAASLAQEKETKKKQKNSVTLQGDRTIVTKTKDGQTIIHESQKQGDFVLEPKKYVNLQLEILEIKPSKTILISSPKLTIASGRGGGDPPGDTDELSLYRHCPHDRGRQGDRPRPRMPEIAGDEREKG